MREQLEKDIKKRFGSTFGDKRRKEMRDEILLNALDRYDEEIGNGATPEDAYETALQSVGDLKELKVNGRTVRIAVFVLICMLVTAVLVIIASLSWFLFAITLIGCALLLPALWRLLLGPIRKPRHIVLLIIGALIVVQNIALVLISLSFSEPSKPAPWLYLDDPTEVETIEFVKFNVHYSPYSKEYDVLLTVPEDSIADLTRDLRKATYKLYAPPQGISDGTRGLIITFKEESKLSVPKVFFGSHTISVFDADEERFEDYRYRCNEKDWEKLLNSYVRPFL